jgi:uncharacterized protein YndB with AHSA1/START domain
MFKKILLVLVLLIAGFAIYVATLPEDFVVERSMAMNAPPEKIFEQINDFHNWQHWSPWAKEDPNAKETFSGPASGKGAKFGWNGNSKVGEGEMEIVESVPNELIKIKLRFKRPMEDESDVEFKLQQKGEPTTLSWKMHGKNNYIGKAMCLVMQMEKEMNKRFDQGLSSIKKTVESDKKADGPKIDQPKTDGPKLDLPKIDPVKEK